MSSLRRLAVEMQRRPVSNRELAKLAGASHPTIGSVLNGGRYADLRTLANLEVALGVEQVHAVALVLSE